MVQKTVDILIGETGSGKTEYIASSFDGTDTEILNCDSRQIYIGLDIGTAKPDIQILNRIKHHMIDIVRIDQAYDVMEFVNNAIELMLRDKHFVISAGTPFYLNILLNGISEIPKISANTRTSLECECKEQGLLKLYSELKDKDPERARQLNPNDKQRILRSIEVIRETGIPISHFYKKKIKPNLYINSITYIRRDRDILRKRIIERTDYMLKRGLIDETRYVADKFSKQVLFEKKIIGYNEILQYLEGFITINEAKEMIIKNTMQYIKQQRTFFNKILKDNEITNNLNIIDL